MATNKRTSCHSVANPDNSSFTVAPVKEVNNNNNNNNSNNSHSLAASWTTSPCGSSGFSNTQTALSAYDDSNINANCAFMGCVKKFFGPKDVIIPPSAFPTNTGKKEGSSIQLLVSPSNSPKTAELSFSHFPRELCTHVLDFLDWPTLCVAAMVCKSWNSMCEDMSTALLRQRTQKHTTWVLWLLYRLDVQIDEIIEDQAAEKKREQERRRKAQTERKRRDILSSYTAQGSGRKRSSSNDESNADDDKKEFDMHSRNGTRIEFLKQTVLLLMDYFEKGAKVRKEEEELRSLRTFGMPRESRTRVVPEYTHLLRILNKQLLETVSILVQVKEGTISLNQNFDIIELSLRRYYAHFVLMFSPMGEASSMFEYPSEIITDPQARAIWEKKVGRGKYFVDFEKFYEDVLLKEMGGRVDENFRYYMQFFLNFPKDDTVTVSKWNLLTRLFGPYEMFYCNFKNYVLGQGFLGLINRIRAEEILKEYPHHVLIRFSRTAPLVLAFSVSRGNYIQHYTNAPSQRSALGLEEGMENISISTFLREQFPDAPLVPMRVDGKAIAAKDTLAHYCEQIAGYEVLS
eukprot:TRINITY_DN1187_c1_g1_i1.p1 TRINITY_DN1187_c1_g1~~TRINITY_DN1187_c1_g1_i1.p1  ORF type:complete len:573 (+),score=119.12 TRINITY_DN1187_c1_g1_i1:562-2280(+)